MVIIVMVLVALQMVINLISDWNNEPEVHDVVDIDQDELETLKKSLGAD